jgi:SAM-dependent methyltransferase
MSGWQAAYLARFYDRSRGFEDGTQHFHRTLAAACPPGGRILEIGSGPDNPTSRFLATLGELHGLDVDPAVSSNPALAASAVLAGERFPHPDASFDLCVSNFLLEHLADPTAHFREVARVLVPGGLYAFRTPNRWHYVALAARLTPHWLHVVLANRLRALPEGAHEPYPTFYRASSRRALARLARRSGLRVERLEVIEKEPSYGMSSRALFLAMTAYERIVNSTEALAFLRSAIIGVLRKTVRGDESRG